MCMWVAARRAQSVLRAQQRGPLGVTRTDQWFIAAARRFGAGKGAPLSIHNGLSIRDERCVNSELVHDQLWTGRDG